MKISELEKVARESGFVNSQEAISRRNMREYDIYFPSLAKVNFEHKFHPAIVAIVKGFGYVELLSAISIGAGKTDAILFNYEISEDEELKVPRNKTDLPFIISNSPAITTQFSFKAENTKHFPEYTYEDGLYSFSPAESRTMIISGSFFRIRPDRDLVNPSEALALLLEYSQKREICPIR